MAVIRKNIQQVGLHHHVIRTNRKMLGIKASLLFWSKDLHHPRTKDSKSQIGMAKVKSVIIVKAPFPLSFMKCWFFQKLYTESQIECSWAAAGMVMFGSGTYVKIWMPEMIIWNMIYARHAPKMESASTGRMSALLRRNFFIDEYDKWIVFLRRGKWVIVFSYHPASFIFIWVPIMVVYSSIDHALLGAPLDHGLIGFQVMTHSPTPGYHHCKRSRRIFPLQDLRALW